MIRVTARGVYTVGGTATNGTFAIYTGSAGSGSDGTSGTALASTGALALPTSVTGFWWKLEAFVQVRAIAQGTGTNTIYTHGDLQIQTATASGTTGNVQVWPLPATSGPTAAAVDTTVAHTLLLGATLSQVTGSPTITCTQFLLETCN